MEGAQFDGIVGLSPGSNHSLAQMSPISFYYNSLTSSRNSQITFGGIDESLIEGEVMYIPVEDRWVATFDEVKIASKTVAKDKKVVVDSGSSMIVLPNSTLSHFLSQLEHCTLSNDLIKCACPTKNIGAYPTLELVYKEHTFTLEPQFYISTEMNDPFCYPLVSSKPTNEDLILLGSPFIRKYYSIFDRDNMRLGLAKAKQELIRKDK